MAISMEIETGHGLVVENAYVKIVELSGNKENINLRVDFYLNKISSDSGKAPLKQEIYSFIPTLNDNFIKEGYDYLKTLEEFMNSIDC